MNISSYNNKCGDMVTHSVDFGKHFFPKKYVVRYNRGNPAVTEFPGTEEGAKNAEQYFNQVVAECNQRLAAAVAEEQK